MKIEITKEEAERIYQEDSDDYELVDYDDWSSRGKYESCAPVYLQKSTGKHFALFLSRSGSYYSDYYYNYPTELVEVKQIEVVRKEWSVTE